jgi:hypothetical protein
MVTAAASIESSAVVGGTGKTWRDVGQLLHEALDHIEALEADSGLYRQEPDSDEDDEEREATECFIRALAKKLGIEGEMDYNILLERADDVHHLMLRSMSFLLQIRDRFEMEPCPDRDVVARAQVVAERAKRYQELRDHVEDYIQNPKTVSARINAIALRVRGNDAGYLEEFAKQYADNFTLLHHYAGRVEALERTVRQHEMGAAEIQRSVGARLLDDETGRA